MNEHLVEQRKDSGVVADAYPGANVVKSEYGNGLLVHQPYPKADHTIYEKEPHSGTYQTKIHGTYTSETSNHHRNTTNLGTSDRVASSSNLYSLLGQGVQDGSNRSIPTHPRSPPHSLYSTLLPNGAKYRHLTSAIRGGMLLDVHIYADHTARVAMISGAAEFLAHVKRNNFYIKGKRIEVQWNDRQYIVKPYIKSKLAAGATRNLIIRNAASKIDEQEMREHMQHIDELIIIDYTVRGNDVHVETNSVHNALFARTCMLNRMPYKTLKIEFGADACAQLLPAAPRVAKMPKADAPSPLSKKRSTNLYEILGNDEGTETSDESLSLSHAENDDGTVDGLGFDGSLTLMTSEY